MAVDSRSAAHWPAAPGCSRGCPRRRLLGERRVTPDDVVAVDAADPRITPDDVAAPGAIDIPHRAVAPDDVIAPDDVRAPRRRSGPNAGWLTTTVSPQTMWWPQTRCWLQRDRLAGDRRRGRHAVGQPPLRAAPLSCRSARASSVAPPALTLPAPHDEAYPRRRARRDRGSAENCSTRLDRVRRQRRLIAGLRGAIAPRASARRRRSRRPPPCWCRSGACTAPSPMPARGATGTLSTASSSRLAAADSAWPGATRSGLLNPSNHVGPREL